MIKNRVDKIFGGYKLKVRIMTMEKVQENRKKKALKHYSVISMLNIIFGLVLCYVLVNTFS